MPRVGNLTTKHVCIFSYFYSKNRVSMLKQFKKPLNESFRFWALKFWTRRIATRLCCLSLNPLLFNNLSSQMVTCKLYFPNINSAEMQISNWINQIYLGRQWLWIEGHMEMPNKLLVSFHSLWPFDSSAGGKPSKQIASQY